MDRRGAGYDTRVSPSTRAEAMQLGLETYQTGKPCKRGHVGPRDTLKGECLECRKAYREEDQKAYREAVQKRQREAA